MTWDLLGRSVTHGIVPDPRRWPVGLGTLGAVVAVGASAVARDGARLAGAGGGRRGVAASQGARSARSGAAAAGYVVACQVPIYLMRSSRFTAIELAQTLRYLPDLVVVLALLAAVAFCAPNRGTSGWLDASRVRTGVVVSCAALFVVSSLYSTCHVHDDLARQPDAGLPGQRAGRASPRRAASSTAPMLDQEVDPWCCNASRGRTTWSSHMFALVRDRPEFSTSTTDLRVLDMTGRLVDAQGDVGARDHPPDPNRSAATSSSPTLRSESPRAVPCCRRNGRRRSTTSPTATDRSRWRCPTATTPRFPCTPASTGCSSDCPALAMPSSCAPTRRRFRCAWPPGPSDTWHRPSRARVIISRRR